MTVLEGALLCGRYRLQQSVGRGGMADVYLAFDNKRQAQVAVKILREDLAEDPDFVRRFRREAEALARLDHPNIVRFYGFEQDGPVAFIVMDYIEGVTLRRQLLDQRDPLELKKVTSILRDLCGALHYAHLNGIVHRDLKPGNVMLKRDGAALLTDFGIARAGAAATMTAPVMGTPPYMSPEQCDGAEPDARSDIYSLGVLLFEMATGRRPFTGDEPGLTKTGTPSRIQEAHLRLPPPEPRSLNSKLPAAASAVILRALAKRPGDRWPSAVSLREAWEAAIGAGVGAAAADKAPRGTAVHPTRRPVPRWAITLAGVILFAAVAAAALVSRGPRAGDVATMPAPTWTQASATSALSVSPPSTPPPPKTNQSGGVQVVSARTLTTETVAAPVPAATAKITGTAIVITVQPSPVEPTLAPTVTLAPTRVPATATLRPAVATPRPGGSPPPPSTGSTGGVVLLRPPAGEKIIGRGTFAWQPTAGFSLKSGERYELIVWAWNEDPLRAGRSPVGGTDGTAVEANLSGVEAVLGLASGQSYYWGVRLITAGGTPLRMLADGRQFLYERLEDNSGSGNQPDPGGCTGPLCP